MSPVNEDAVEDDPISQVEVVQRAVMSAAGASERVPLRVIVLFVVAIVCATLAPVPFNGVGVAALVMLALDTAIHRRT